MKNLRIFGFLLVLGRQERRLQCNGNLRRRNEEINIELSLDEMNGEEEQGYKLVIGKSADKLEDKEESDYFIT